MRRVAVVVLLAVVSGACAADSSIPPALEDHPALAEQPCVDQHSPDIAPAADLRAVTLPAGTLYPSDPQHPGAEYVDGEWHIVSPSYMYYPLPVAAGERIAGFSWQVHKRTGPNEIAASIQKLGTRNETLPESVSDEYYSQCGTITIGTSKLDHAVADRESYILRVAANAANGTDTYGDAVLFVAP